MTLRIAFDLDGTLADLDSSLESIAGALFPGTSAEATHHGEGAAAGPNEGGLTPEEEQLEPAQVRALTRPQQRAVWDAVRGTANFWETLGETEPGIVSRLAGIAEERRWEVIFLTERPPVGGDTTQRQSQRWLVQHGFEMPSVFVLLRGTSRGKVATALDLDVLVDDRAENCLDVKADSQARAFLVAREPSDTMTTNAKRMGMEVVRSVGECLDELTGAPDRPGLLGRLKRMMRA